jgi:hypothetical protein
MPKITGNLGDESDERTSSQISSQIPDEFANSADTDFDARFHRLMHAFGAKNETELGRALGIKQQSVGPHVKKRHIPSKWYIAAAEEGISVDWILFGSGPMLRVKSEQGAATEARIAGHHISDEEVQFLIRMIDVVFDLLTFGGQTPLKESSQLILIVGAFYKLFYHMPNRVEILEHFREEGLGQLVDFITKLQGE